MTAIEMIRNTMTFCREVTLGYLNDLSDADLLIRSVPKSNHIAWMLGHMLGSECDMMSAMGHRMPALPPDFTEAYTKETASSDNPANFLSQPEYLDLLEKIRTATLAGLDTVSESDLDQPAPEVMREFAPTVGQVLMVIALHELMHAAQFVPIRRKLGKEPLF
ncbi:MAG: DinB family protein [Planctomycetota bacterium]